MLSINSPIDSLVLDLESSFHTTVYHELMENYIAGNYGKIYLVDGQPLDIVGMRDICLKMSNESIWKT